MITKIKCLAIAANAALIVVLLGLLAWLKLRLSSAQRRAAKKQLAESQAVTQEVQRRHQAEQDVIAESQVELSQALGEIGKRDYLEDEKW